MRDNRYNIEVYVYFFIVKRGVVTWSERISLKKDSVRKNTASEKECAAEAAEKF